MSVNRKLSEYLAYRETTKVLLYTSGLWPTKNSTMLYRLFPYFCIAASSLTSLGILGFVVHHITRVPVVVRGMSIGTSFLSGVVKIFFIVINRKRATELHYILDHYFSTALNDEKLSKLMLIGISTVKRLCWVLLFTVLLAAVVFVLTPIMDILHQRRNNIHPIKYPFMYSGLYPWYIANNGIVYKFHFMIELFATVNLFCVTCGVDALFAYYVFQMIGQLRAMSYDLSQANDEEDLKIVIKRCVQQHKVLLRCRDSMEKIFGPIVFWMMGTNAIVLCAVIFQMSLVINSINLLEFLLIK